MRRLLAVLALVAASAHADEGMWTYNHFPSELVQQRYGFAPNQAWLDHVRLSSVRFNSGGSGSFVSSTGLVMTNHHVGADCIAKLGASDHDYHRDGFYATAGTPEIKCADLELNVLVGIDDVTDEVTKAVGANDAETAKLRRDKMTEIEKRCQAAGTPRCDVVTLYRGGRYDLYKYKKYTDVRLVFAPEFAIAFYGGDPDNFTFPRYDLDVAIFRAYENGKAVVPTQFLKWSAEGPHEGELVFTSGHPGSTSRLATKTMLETYRDVSFPLLIADLVRQRDAMKAFSALSADNERDARKVIFSVENSLKAYNGYLDGLKDPALVKKRTTQEDALKARVVGKPEMAAPGGAGNAYDSIEKAEAIARKDFERWMLLEGRRSRQSVSEPNPFNASLFRIARSLVRLADESALPNEKRLPEYQDAARSKLELWLYSPAPIHPALEEAQLTSALAQFAAKLGSKDPLVKKALAGKTPAARAHELVAGTKLADVAVRKSLGTKAAQDASKDPLIAFARSLDTDARAIRKRWEDDVDGPEEIALGQIARAQLALDGPNVPPDATFTLRLSFGKVAGYEDHGKHVPPMTVFMGLYAKALKMNNQPPYQLPQRWVDSKSKLKPLTPMNVVSTNDIIGGNSGSPLVNRAGEVVGLIFDGNIQSLANNFVYRDAQDRAVSVDSVALLEAMRNVYGAGALVDELTGKPQKK